MVQPRSGTFSIETSLMRGSLPRLIESSSPPATPNRANAGRAAALSARPPAAQASRIQPSGRPVQAGSAESAPRGAPPASRAKAGRAELGTATWAEAGEVCREAGESGRKRRCSAKTLATTTVSIDIGDEKNQK